MHVVDSQEIEPSKENVRPLASGRRASELSKSVGMSHVERERAAESGRSGFERRLESDLSCDRLALWLEYIAWMEVNYPSGCSDYLLVLERCVKEFQDNTAYADSLKYLKVWIKYAQNLKDPEDLFDYLFSKRIGCKRALFYEAWATVLESKKKYTQARQVFLNGIHAGAKPVSKLQQRFDAFEQRHLDRLAMGEPEAPPQPKALNAISERSAGRSHRHRSKATSKGGIDTRSVPQPQANFSIFAGPSTVASSEPWNEFGTEAARDKENRSRPASWKQPLASSQPRQMEDSAFAIFNDDLPYSEPKPTTVTAALTKRSGSMTDTERLLANPVQHLQSVSERSGYKAALLRADDCRDQLSFEEARMRHYGFESAEDYDWDNEMEMTVNYGQILSQRPHESPPSSRRQSRKFGSVLSEKPAEAFTIFDDTATQHSAKSEDESDHNETTFGTGTVTINTKSAYRDVMKMFGNV